MMEWRKWLQQQRENSTMAVQRRSLFRGRLAPWHNNWKNGTYSRTDGKFWWLAGFLVQVFGGGREVKWWAQPLIEKDGDGVIILVVNAAGTKVVLTARQEPGWGEAKVRLGPSLQASASNLAAAHGGTKPPGADLFEAAVKSRIPQDGGIFYRLWNWLGYVVVDETTYDLQANERWFTREELLQAFQEGETSSHLLQAYGAYYASHG